MHKKHDLKKMPCKKLPKRKLHCFLKKSRLRRRKNEKDVQLDYILIANAFEKSKNVEPRKPT